MPIQVIQPRELAAKADSVESVEVIDVRTPMEYREAHCVHARNVPLQDLDPASFKHRAGNSPLYVICKSGGRGRQACEKLQAAGVENVVNVDGGTQAWIDSGLPVVRGRKAVSLERQVRIAAGMLVLVGVILGGFVHPALLGLAAFVGAGLVFAGVTDTCGMGLMLAQMPWNRVTADCPTGGAK